MKKFFAFIIAAAALMTGCKDPITGDEPDPEPKPEPFYGMMLNEAEVINRGDYYNNGTNSYIISMYKAEGSGEEKEYSRIVAAEIITPEVNDGIIPEGKYTVEASTLAEGNFNDYLSGSYYIRNTEADGYFMLVTGGYFEVKHLAGGGYQLTASYEGINALGGEALAKTESRFEGQPVMMGLPASNNYEVYTPYGAQAQYMSMGDGLALWQIILGNTGAFSGEGNVVMDSFIIIGEDLGETVIPQGTFPIDRFGFMAPGTTLAASHITAASVQDEPVEDDIYEGYVTIKAKGEGKYSIESVTFGANGAYKESFEGGVYIMTNEVDFNTQVAQAIYAGEYEGVPYWVLFLGDPERDELIRLYVNTAPSDDPYAAGIPTGSYVVSDTMQPGTIDAAYQTESGWSGSLIIDLTTQSKLVDLILDGQLDVVNNGDGTYAVEFSFDTYQEATYVGQYEGAVQTSDQSGGGDEGDLKAIQIAVDEAQMLFVGLGEWVVYLPGEQTNTCFMLDLYNNEDATFADGLASGTYTVAETYENCTIWPGYIDDEGYLGGSLLLTYDMKNYYDLVLGGEMVVENKGDGNYSFDGVLTGERYEVSFQYDGPAVAEDYTAESVAPAKVAPKALAPLKSNVAQPKERRIDAVRNVPMVTAASKNMTPAVKLNF